MKSSNLKAVLDFLKIKKTTLTTSGQSLVEVIVALAVAVLILSALVAGVVVSVRNARFAKNQSLATKYAQEVIEEARLYRDQNDWDNFWEAKIGDTGSTTEGPTPVETGSIFLQTIKYKDVSDPEDATNRVKVTVTVSWSEGGRTHQSQLITYLSRWE